MKFAVFYIINNARQAGYSGVDYSTPRPAVFLHIWIIPYTNSNNLGQITNINVYEGSNGTPVFSQTDNYDENGVYLGSSYGGTKYTYGYDDTGFVTSIGYGETAENASVTPLLQYSYYGDAYGASGAIDSNQLYSKTYANGDTEEYMYSKISGGNKTQVEHVNENGSTIGTYIYNYNTNGAMISQEYRKNGYGQVSYDYGDLSNVEEQMLTIGGLEFYLEYTNHYDTLNNRIERSQIYSLIGCSTTDYKTLDYSYNDEGQLSEFSYDSYDVEYTYDKMGRLTNRLAPMSYGYQDIQNESYVYKTYGNGYTTNLLTSIDDQTYENNDRTATYDANGYVTSITYNGNTYTYTYDGVGRLASETIGGATQTYTYAMENEKFRETIKGASFQWAGKFSIMQVAEDYPLLDTINSEMECGNGENTWQYAMYGYEMMHHYFRFGARACVYWNMALDNDGYSTWGWRQNSLIVVKDGNYRFTPDFYLIKHFSHFVKKGAVRLVTQGSFSSNATVFQNPNGEKVAIMINPFDREKIITIEEKNYRLAPRSFNSIILKNDKD